jgi:hypothetical protein
MKHYRTKRNELIVKPTWLAKATSYHSTVLANLIDHIESGKSAVKTKQGTQV